MAGDKVNLYSIGDANIEALMVTQDQAFKSKINISLTELNNNTVPEIAAGSSIEDNGTLYKFTANEALLGSPSDGVVFIRIIPSSTTCTAEMTNTAPTWSDLKHGWYGTGAAANYAYIPYFLIKSSPSYIKHKWNFKSLVYVEGATGSLSSGATANLIYPNIIYDLFSEYNVSTGYITPTRPGIYISQVILNVRAGSGAWVSVPKTKYVNASGSLYEDVGNTAIVTQLNLTSSHKVQLTSASGAIDSYTSSWIWYEL